MTELSLESLPDPGDRYTLGRRMGKGVYSEVYEAADTQAGQKKVAIKIQAVSLSLVPDIHEEYRVLRDLSSHPNLPDFYGVFMRKARERSDSDKLWFIMELCEGGPVTSLVQGLQYLNRRMSEEHIAFILRETVKALVHLHENHVMHRDVKGSNILITKEGEIKLVDFGLARELSATMAKRSTNVGSPCWMAPEVATTDAYDNRADVWAIGITAIELGDGHPPYADMNPSRALFQITRNPPPTLKRPSQWSKNYNDFITECLEKNPEHRPYMEELLEHPFFTSLPENDYHLSQELKKLCEEVRGKVKDQHNEVTVRGGCIQADISVQPEPMMIEDLAAMDDISEDSILSELGLRLSKGHSYTFVGDVLLFLNPHEEQDTYGIKNKRQYQNKSRIDNAPHIYAVSDKAYQDVFHNDEPQFIFISGESGSGKTTCFQHALDQLLFLGKTDTGACEQIQKALNVVHAFGNAETFLSDNSTRHILQFEVTFSRTGKVTGAVIALYLLDKWRVSKISSQQSTFNIFHYFYAGLSATGKLSNYSLKAGKEYNFLQNSKKSTEEKVKMFQQTEQELKDFGIEDKELSTIYKILAAILLLGEINFEEGDEGYAEIKTPAIVSQVSKLLSIDEAKLSWALVNYCVVEEENAVRRRSKLDEAEEARDALAQSLYARLVDWIIHHINSKLSLSRAIFGDHCSITIVDLFGFECFKSNGLVQLLINTLNEQMQYFYNQRVFIWEMQDTKEEELPEQVLHFYDNRPTVDALLAKQEGLLYLLDKAGSSSEDLIGFLRTYSRAPYVRSTAPHQFSIAHYTGSVTYNAELMGLHNRDFLPPELVVTLRKSEEQILSQLFTSKLSKTGNATLPMDELQPEEKKEKKSRWGAALMADNPRLRRYNTPSKGQYSQTKRLRTAAAVFRSCAVELLRALTGSGGCHFVRCIQPSLNKEPRTFIPDLVRQQIKALAVVDTAKARKDGFPHRIQFAEFLRRYKYLAFDFDENVELNRDNSRLLLVRLKLEDYLMGKTKVFIKYYHEEYLARTYEIQVKKIVKVQTMMRAFLAKRNVAGRMLKHRQESLKREQSIEENNQTKNISEDEAATVIQKQFRGYKVRKEMGPLCNDTGFLNEETAKFMKPYCKKWKSKSLFQVLLQYRAIKLLDVTYFCQQAHLYNQNAYGFLASINESVNVKKVEDVKRASIVLGKRRPAVMKVPFRLSDQSTYFQSNLTNLESTLRNDDDQESWDAPLNRGGTIGSKREKYLGVRDQEVQTCSSPVNEQHGAYSNQDSFIQTPYSRDPENMNFNKAGPQKYGNYYLGQDRRTNSNVYKAPKFPQNEATRNSSHPQQTNYGNSTNKSNINANVTSYNKGNYNTNHQNYTPAYKNQHNNRPTNNPIAELQMKGRRDISNDDSDDPPFNFQAMLRKTNCNRPSLKRGEKEINANVSTAQLRSVPQQRFESNTVIYNNSSPGINKRKQGIGSPTYSDVARKSYGKGPAPSMKKIEEDVNLDFANSNTHYGNKVNRQSTIELAPGLVIEGEVSEL